MKRLGPAPHRVLGPRLRALSVGLALASAMCGVTAGVASADATSDYNTGLRLGAKAYQYGVPLLDSNRVYTTGTSGARGCDPTTGHAPVNEFCSFRNLATPSEHAAPAPNNDTLYTSAWLVNLSKQPQVVHAPPIRLRFWEFELLDPWTNNFYNITSIPTRLGAGDFGVTSGGNWALVGPGFHGKLPHGVKLVRVPYDRVWIAGRTYVGGPSDLPSVHRIQTQYSITPLSKFGKPYRIKPPQHPGTPIVATIPGTQPGQDPLQFYAALAREMRSFPPPPADRALLTELRQVDIGPGLDPAASHLSAATLRGLGDAVRQGHLKSLLAFQSFYLKNFAKFNGYAISDLGNWGTDYTFRAISDAVAIGGQRADIALYPVALYDDQKAPLTGSKRYVLRIPRSRLPIPVSAFWSLTLYDSNSFLVPNPLHRYVINGLSHLHRNADGSIDLYVQHDEPSAPAQRSNWLPAPASGSIRLIWRLYGLGKALPGVLNGTGWEPPLIQPCDSTGHSAGGLACAS
jgi:hypothetical protein